MSAFSAVDVNIWLEDTESLDPEALALAGQVLSEEERIRRDRFRSHEDQRDYAAAHSLLRRSLSRHFPGREPSSWRFEKNASGKPYLAGGDSEAPGVDFSLSHTRGLAACAISSARVGIDAERLRQNIDYEGIAQSSFSHQEIEALEQLPTGARRARVLELWTLKEAFLKATGRGLSAGLDSVWFEILPSGAIRFHAPCEADESSWKFALFKPHPEVWMAVAAEARHMPRVLLQGREVTDLKDSVDSTPGRKGKGLAEA